MGVVVFIVKQPTIVDENLFHATETEDRDDDFGKCDIWLFDLRVLTVVWRAAPFFLVNTVTVRVCVCVAVNLSVSISLSRSLSMLGSDTPLPPAL